MRRLSALTIRWKLQIGFMLITMLTTLFSKFITSREMKQMIAIAQDNGISDQVLSLFIRQHESFIISSIWGSAIEFIIQFILIGIVAKIFLKPIMQLCSAAEAIESGDLTQEVKVTTHDEIGSLGEHFNGMRLILSRIMSSVNETALHINQSAYQIGEISHEIETISKDQAAQSEQVMGTAKNLHDMSQKVLIASDKTSEQSNKMAKNSEAAIAQVSDNVIRLTKVRASFNDVAEEVVNMEKNSQSILEIVSVIRSIADQTNLLALNAAIEAARAGESGRGFAVVADEVRQLSQRTADSSTEVEKVLSALTKQIDQISEQIQNLVNDMDITTEKFNQTSTDLTHLEKDILTTSDLSQEISGHINSQLNIFSDLQTRLGELFKQLTRNTVRISNTANIGDSLFHSTTKLNQQLAGLKYEKINKAAEQHAERAHPRIESHLLVSVKAKGKWHDGITEDMSFSGLALKLNSHLRKGEKILLRIKMPQDNLNAYLTQNDLTLEGIVMRVENGGEMYGVRFTEPHLQEQSLIRCLEFYSNPNNHLNTA